MAALPDRWHADHATLYTPDEIEQIAAAAHFAREFIRRAFMRTRPGVSTAWLAECIHNWMTNAEIEPLFLGYQAAPDGPPFPSVACISVNDEVVHAIPGDRLLELGDVVTIDLGLRLEGWCGDAADTIRVGPDHDDPLGLPPPDERADGLVQTLKALGMEARDLIKPGVRWSAVAQAMEQVTRDAGCGWVSGFVGHGIGRSLHEPPKAPAYWTAYDGPDFELREGMVLAVEPIVTRTAPPRPGPTPLREDADGWTVRTADGSLAGHWERMVAITPEGARWL